MKIELAYGKKGLEFEMPSQAKPVVIRKPPFEIPEDILNYWRMAGKKSQKKYNNWKKKVI